VRSDDGELWVCGQRHGDTNKAVVEQQAVRSRIAGRSCGIVGAVDGGEERVSAMARGEKCKACGRADAHALRRLVACGAGAAIRADGLKEGGGEVNRARGGIGRDSAGMSEKAWRVALLVTGVAVVVGVVVVAVVGAVLPQPVTTAAERRRTVVRARGRNALM